MFLLLHFSSIGNVRSLWGSTFVNLPKFVKSKHARVYLNNTLLLNDVQANSDLKRRLWKKAGSCISGEIILESTWIRVISKSRLALTGQSETGTCRRDQTDEHAHWGVVGAVVHVIYCPRYLLRMVTWFN